MKLHARTPKFEKRTPELRLKLEGWRSRFVLVVALGGFGVLIGRAFYLQALNTSFLQAKGEARYGRVVEMPASRGPIKDRNGQTVAISTPAESIWVSPEDFEVDASQVAALAGALGVHPDEIRQKIARKDRQFAYLKRQISPEQAAKVMALRIPGVFQQREFRRFYPAGEVMAHVVGFTGVEDRGQEGMELAAEGRLAGAPGSRKVIKDRKGRIVEDVQALKAPRDGEEVALAIDQRLQFLAHRELKAAVDLHRAKGGSLVILDARTGEVLALVNQPDYNPNNRANVTGRQTRNRSVTDLFEPGSTMKPFTVAAAIDSGIVTPATLIQTGQGAMTMGRWTINDSHPNGAITVAQVIQKSSNIGSAKIQLRMPAETMGTLYRELGFGVPPKTGFPGEAKGQLRPWAQWRPIEQATMSYGHGISLSLLQLARAYLVFAGDGDIKPVTVVKLNSPVATTQVISANTALQVRKMLELAVQPGGTAPLAQITGYRVAGKTGTAHKLDGANYAADKYVSSFIGFAPASAPRLIIAVMIDEPRAGHYYGGTVAAPVFGNVMAGSLRLLGVKPDAPVNNVILPPPGAPEVREEV